MNQRKFMVSTRRLAMMLIMALGSSLMAFAASAENSIQAVQQQGDVKGTVTDANGETIIGATVRVLGTQNAAITDIDGNFTVKANPGQIIEISYVGCKTARVKATSQPMKVVLEDDSKTLNEVVVVGYGTMYNRQNEKYIFTKRKIPNGVTNSSEWGYISLLFLCTNLWA